MKTAIIDGDFIKYTAGFVSESRSIRCTNKETGEVLNFKNRTEFYGGRKKDGGWLGEQNKTRESPLSADDFDIIDIQEPEPSHFAIHTAKKMIESYLSWLGTDKYIGYIGKGDSFRVDRSTIVKYKGNREGLLKPINMDLIEEWLIMKKRFQVIRGIEADDQCVIDAVADENNVIVGVDKDYYGCPVSFLNINNPDDGAVDCRGFGSLWLKETKNKDGKVSKEPKGKGRMWLYYQVAYGDDTDCYWSTSANPSYKFGAMSAYKWLCNAKDDKEALELLVKLYKEIYPEPKEIIGWRGDKIVVDWKYVLSENFDMARMLKSHNDKLTIDDVLKRFNVEV